MNCPKCQSARTKKFGRYGKRRIQRYRCLDCKATFSERQPKPLGTHTIGVEKATQIISMMVEGVSLRAIARLTDTDLNTIMSLLLTVGKKCRTLFDLRVRNVRPRFTEFDEIWCFVHTKERHLNAGDPAEWGDAYTWTAIDAQTKLLISYHIGKRDAESANTFIGDYNSRVIGRHQVTSDGLRSFIDAIETHFGADSDFAQLVKIYGKPDNAGPDWYGSGKIIETVPTPISGNPDEAHISTSYVERSNLTIRMQLRRFTRLTNGFSKKLSHLKAAVTIFVAWYNFVRVHSSLRVTPAMEAGISDHIWSVEQLLLAA